LRRRFWPNRKLLAEHLGLIAKMVVSGPEVKQVDHSSFSLFKRQDSPRDGVERSGDRFEANLQPLP